MLRVARASFVSSSRSLSTAPQKPVKPYVELQRIAGVSLKRAKEALDATSYDLDAAVRWLEEATKQSGAISARKLAGRPTNEGVVGIAVLSDGSRGTGIRAALVELGCETDFVSRGEIFSGLATNVAHTVAFLAEPLGSSLSVVPVDSRDFGNAPCLSPVQRPTSTVRTVTESMHYLTGKVHENLVLRRLVALVGEPSNFSLGSYVHGATPGFPSLGRIGCLATLKVSGELPQDPEFDNAYSSLRRAIARQIVGMNVEKVTSTENSTQPEPSSPILYHQPFVMLPGASESETVEQALQSWGKKWNVGVSVESFIKWTLKETLKS